MLTQAQNQPTMANVMAAEAGRLAYQAGRIPVKVYDSNSSPLIGVIR